MSINLRRTPEGRLLGSRAKRLKTIAFAEDRLGRSVITVDSCVVLCERIRVMVVERNVRGRDLRTVDNRIGRNLRRVHGPTVQN